MTQDSGFNGQWEGVLTELNGTADPIRFTLMSDGVTLTGTNEAGGSTINIYDGKVWGNVCAFHFDFGNYTVNCDGTLSGDSIRLGVDFEGMKFLVMLNRSAPAPSAAVPDPG